MTLVRLRNTNRTYETPMKVKEEALVLFFDARSFESTERSKERSGW